MKTSTLYLASIIVCVYLLLPGIGAAQNCTVVGTAVFYVNGVWVTTRDDADNSLTDDLAPRFDVRRQNTVLQNECIDYVLAYNQSELYLGDLLEAGVQILGGAMSHFWRFWAGLDPLPDWFQQQALSITQSIDNATYVLDGDLREHVKLYRQSLSNGHRVAVVAHSQGNLYANAAFNILYDGLDGQAPLTTQSFGVAAVATVANFVEGDGPYTTSFGDVVIDGLIIAALRLGLPSPLLPNTFGLPSLADPTGHLFVPSYLEGSSTGPSVLQDLLDVILSLQRPPISPPEPEAHYLSFRGGNPGIPADGVVVQADASSNIFTIVPMFSLSGVMNGITVSVFPPNPVPMNTRMFVQLGAIVEGLPVDSCRLSMSLSEGARPVVNGVVGIAAVFTQAFLDSTAEGLGRAIPACAGATSDKFSLTSVQLFSQDFNFVSVVDAVAVGIGQNVFPQ